MMLSPPQMSLLTTAQGMMLLLSSQSRIMSIIKKKLFAACSNDYSFNFKTQQLLRIRPNHKIQLFPTTTEV